MGREMATAMALRRCPEGGGYLAIDGRYWQFMPALACTGIETASSWAWCRSRSRWVLFGLFSVIYGVSQIVTETELRRAGNPAAGPAESGLRPPGSRQHADLRR
jgi:hypothetical protein